MQLYAPTQNTPNFTYQPHTFWISKKDTTQIQIKVAVNIPSLLLAHHPSNLGCRYSHDGCPNNNTQIQAKTENFPREIFRKRMKAVGLRSGTVSWFRVCLCLRRCVCTVCAIYCAKLFYKPRALLCGIDTVIRNCNFRILMFRLHSEGALHHFLCAT